MAKKKKSKSKSCDMLVRRALNEAHDLVRRVHTEKIDYATLQDWAGEIRGLIEKTKKRCK